MVKIKTLRHSSLQSRLCFKPRSQTTSSWWLRVYMKAGSFGEILITWWIITFFLWLNLLRFFFLVHPTSFGGKASIFWHWAGCWIPPTNIWWSSECHIATYFLAISLALKPKRLKLKAVKSLLFAKEVHDFPTGTSQDFSHPFLTGA